MSGIQFMSCTAEATVHGREPGYPYLAALMLDWDDYDDPEILVPAGDKTHGITYVQSAYPFYVYYSQISEMETPQVSIITFARGEKSVRCTVNWDNYKGPGHSGDSSALEHAYLHNCVIEYSDNFDSSGTIGYGMESRFVNGVDVLGWTSSGYTNYATIVNEGEHLGALRMFGGTMSMYNRNTRLPTIEEVSPSGYAGRWMRFPTLIISHPPTYSCNYRRGPFADIRVIYNKTFSSMQEWFNYCLTH